MTYPVDTTAKKLRGAVLAQTSADLTAIGATWYYNYTFTPTAAIGATGFIPMVCGSVDLATLEASNDADTILLFNEPNVKEQGNMTLAQVVAGIKRVRDLRPNANLVSPALFMWATRNFNYTYTQMFKAYRTAYGKYPEFYAVAVHGYGYYSTDIGTIITKVRTELNNMGLRTVPIWLTEFGPWYPASKTLARNLVINMKYRLKERSYVKRFAYFPARKYGGVWDPYALLEANGNTTIYTPYYKGYTL